MKRLLFVGLAAATAAFLACGDSDSSGDNNSPGGNNNAPGANNNAPGGNNNAPGGNNNAPGGNNNNVLDDGGLGPEDDADLSDPPTAATVEYNFSNGHCNQERQDLSTDFTVTATDATDTMATMTVTGSIDCGNGATDLSGVTITTTAVPDELTFNLSCAFGNTMSGTVRVTDSDGDYIEVAIAGVNVCDDGSTSAP